MHRTEMVIYFVQAFFQQNVSGSVYTGCKRPLCCVFVWVKMFKVGCRRPVTDTGSGLFGLDRVGGERILNLSLSLDLTGDRGVCTPENACLGHGSA